MATERDNQSCVDLDQQRDPETMNLPAGDRGRPRDDAEGKELPGETQETPPATVIPPGGDPIKV